MSAAVAAKLAAARAGAGVGRSIDGPVAVAALGRRLGVSTREAHHALQLVSRLDGRGGVDPANPEFAAIARGLGVTPVQLIAGLDAVKQGMAGR